MNITTNLQFEKRQYNQQINQKQTDTKNRATSETSQAQGSRVDKYVPSEQTDKVTYEKPKRTVTPDVETVNRLKAESEQHYKQLQDLVNRLLKKQGYTIEDAQSKDITVQVDDETRLKAEAAIAEGGEHSVENVSNRLVDFAIAISGGDKSKLDELKGAIQAGFDAAERIFGGTLPQISHDTLQATMEKLDQWAETTE